MFLRRHPQNGSCTSSISIIGCLRTSGIPCKPCQFRRFGLQLLQKVGCSWTIAWGPLLSSYAIIAPPYCGFVPRSKILSKRHKQNHGLSVCPHNTDALKILKGRRYRWSRRSQGLYYFRYLSILSSSLVPLVVVAISRPMQPFVIANSRVCELKWSLSPGEDGQAGEAPCSVRFYLENTN